MRQGFRTLQLSQVKVGWESQLVWERKNFWDRSGLTDSKTQAPPSSSGGSILRRESDGKAKSTGHVAWNCLQPKHHCIPLHDLFDVEILRGTFSLNASIIFYICLGVRMPLPFGWWDGEWQHPQTENPKWLAVHLLGGGDEKSATICWWKRISTGSQAIVLSLKNNSTVKHTHICIYIY